MICIYMLETIEITEIAQGMIYNFYLCSSKLESDDRVGPAAPIGVDVAPGIFVIQFFFLEIESMVTCHDII
jgi:hypothetical protein